MSFSGRRFSNRGWVLDQTSIFAQVDAFVQRCKDLIEVGRLPGKEGRVTVDPGPWPGAEAQRGAYGLDSA